MRDKHLLRELQDGNGLVPADAGEVVKEGVQGLSAFEIVEQSLNWHPGPHEDRGASKDVRVGMDDRFLAHGNAYDLRTFPPLFPTSMPSPPRSLDSSISLG